MSGLNEAAAFSKPGCPDMPDMPMQPSASGKTAGPALPSCRNRIPPIVASVAPIPLLAQKPSVGSAVVRAPRREAALLDIQFVSEVDIGPAIQQIPQV